jgi:hypothetical protein
MYWTKSPKRQATKILKINSLLVYTFSAFVFLKSQTSVAYVYVQFILENYTGGEKSQGETI